MYLNLGSGFLDRNPLAVVLVNLLISFTGIMWISPRRHETDVNLPVALTSFYKLFISPRKPKCLLMICPLLKVVVLSVLCFLENRLQLLYFKYIVDPRDYKGDREGIPHIHPIP